MRLIENIESVRFLARHAREEGEVEGALVGETPDFCHVLASQLAVLDQERGGVPAPHERELSARLAGPSALHGKYCGLCFQSESAGEGVSGAGFPQYGYPHVQFVLPRVRTRLFRKGCKCHSAGSRCYRMETGTLAENSPIHAGSHTRS